MKKKLYILLVILWLGFIFYMSHQSSTVSNMQSDKVMHLIKNIIESEQINSFRVRKGAHMFIFFILGILFFKSIYNGKNLLKSIFISLLLSFLCACSDEYHQTFVGRTGEFKDVLIDFSGSFIGVFIVSLIIKLKILLKKCNLLSKSKLKKINSERDVVDSLEGCIEFLKDPESEVVRKLEMTNKEIRETKDNFID